MRPAAVVLLAAAAAAAGGEGTGSCSADAELAAELAAARARIAELERQLQHTGAGAGDSRARCRSDIARHLAALPRMNEGFPELVGHHQGEERDSKGQPVRGYLLAGPIPRLPKPPPRDEFFRDYVTRSYPVVFEGGATGWPALERWQKLSYIAKGAGILMAVSKDGKLLNYETAGRTGRISDARQFPKELHKRLVSVNVGRGGHFSHPVNGTNKLYRPHSIMVPPAQMLRLLRDGPKKTGLSFSIEQDRLATFYPKLQKDIDYDGPGSLLSGNLTRSRRINILASGRELKRTFLHHDEYENLVVQVRGTKQVQLYNPSYIEWLYPSALDEELQPGVDDLLEKHRDYIFGKGGVKMTEKVRDKSTNRVPIDHNYPDWSRFPNFARAQPYVATLHPGDTLFIPAGWLHSVNSLPDDGGINLAVNWWWESDDLRRVLWESIVGLVGALTPEPTPSTDLPLPR